MILATKFPIHFRFGVAVQDFGKSWTSGLAFLAVIKSIDPSLVDMRKALLRTPKENLEEAFRIAHYSLGIPRLLDPEGCKIMAIFTCQHNQIKCLCLVEIAEWSK